MGSGRGPVVGFSDMDMGSGLDYGLYGVNVGQGLTQLLLDPGPKRGGGHRTIVTRTHETNPDAATLPLEGNQLDVSPIRPDGRSDLIQDLVDLLKRGCACYGTQFTILGAASARCVPVDSPCVARKN